jgi:hypothetical protein
MSKLRLSIQLYWGALCKDPPFDALFPRIGRPYPGQVFYNRHAYHHPIKHLLLIGFLFGDWDSFLNAYESYVRVDISQESLKYIPSFIDKQKTVARNLVHKKISLRTVARITGLSVTTVRSIAGQERVAIAARAKLIYPEERRGIWRKLLLGETTQNIAHIYGVSVGSIELILRCYPYLVPLRKKIRLYKARNKYREKLIQLLTADPSMTRNNIRCEHQAVYSWLYRHDREWMYLYLPKKQLRKYYPRKKAINKGGNNQ